MENISYTPLILSFKVAFFSTLLNCVLGLATAFLLAKIEFKGKNFLDAILMQPLIMPPTVLGYYLLVVLGRQGPIGQFLENTFGISLVFNFPAAVIAAFISSFPLFLKPARAAIELVNPHLENSARLLGKTELQVFLTVTLPIAKKGIIAGIALAFARSLGEFGTTLMIAGNIPGKTQTLSIAIYDAVQAGNSGQANLLVFIITVISIIILFVINKAVSKNF